MSQARSQGAKDAMWGAIGVGLGGAALYWVFSTVQASGNIGNGKALAAGAGLVALLGSIKLSEGLLALALGVRISVEDFDSLKGRDKTFTALFAVFWVLGVFAVLGLALKYGGKWF